MLNTMLLPKYNCYFSTYFLEDGEDEPPSFDFDHGVFITNLPYELTQWNMYEIFSKFGKIQICNIVPSKIPNKSNSGVVFYYDAGAVQQALTANKQYIGSNMIYVKMLPKRI